MALTITNPLFQFSLLATLRLLLAIVATATENVDLHQRVVKTAFLKKELKEGIYENLPEGVIDASSPNHVYKLKNALWGLEQAQCIWVSRILFSS